MVISPESRSACAGWRENCDASRWLEFWSTDTWPELRAELGGGIVRSISAHTGLGLPGTRPRFAESR